MNKRSVLTNMMAVLGVVLPLSSPAQLTSNLYRLIERAKEGAGLAAN